MMKLTRVLLVAISCAGALSCATGPALKASDVPTAQSLFEQGLVAQETGDSTRAEQYLAAALEAGMPEEKVLPRLLATCLAGDRYGTALHYARRHLLRHPNDWSLRYLVANLHFATGQNERALMEAERLIEEQPRSADPYYLLALVESERPRADRATTAALHRYLALDPKGSHANDARRMLRRSARNARGVR